MRYFCFCLNAASSHLFLFTGVFLGQVLYDANNKVIGIGTNDMGISKDGSKKENFQRGVEIKGFILHVSFFYTYNLIYFCALFHFLEQKVSL